MTHSEIRKSLRDALAEINDDDSDAVAAKLQSLGVTGLPRHHCLCVVARYVMRAVPNVTRVSVIPHKFHVGRVYAVVDGTEFMAEMPQGVNRLAVDFDDRPHDFAGLLLTPDAKLENS